MSAQEPAPDLVKEAKQEEGESALQKERGQQNEQMPAKDKRAETKPSFMPDTVEQG